MIRFPDRVSAGRQLLEKMRTQFAGKSGVILGLPRGGIIVAGEIAGGMGWPLDVLCPRKIGLPSNPEVAIGAVAEQGLVVWDHWALERLELTKEQKDQAVARAMEEIQRRLQVYRRGQPPSDLRGKVVFLVDDGVATGLTTLAAIRGLRYQGAHDLWLAVPVGPREALMRLRSELQGMVCLQIPADFLSVGQFYVNFPQVTDDEVVRTLEDFRNGT